MVWFSSKLKSDERMVMKCRENEASLDESPAEVFVNTRKVGERGGGVVLEEKLYS